MLLRYGTKSMSDKRKKIDKMDVIKTKTFYDFTGECYQTFKELI